MAAGKEIRAKIKSVENTRKITKAMEMVSASKMRKAQDRMRAARPYGDKIRNITANLSTANPEYRSPYMREAAGNAKAVGFIVVTTDKGLCGGLNTNVLRAVTNKMRDVQGAGGTGAGGGHRQQGPRLPEPHRRQGREPRHAARRQAAARQADRPGQGDARRCSSRARLDAVYLCYTRFINTMKQEPWSSSCCRCGAERLQQSAEEKSAVRLGLHLRARRARP